MDDAELDDWIAGVAGCPVTGKSAVGYGASNLTTFVHLADGREWVTRCETGHGPTADTELTLRREATLYEALGPYGVRMPVLRGLSADGSVLLTERASGTHELPALESPERAAVIDDYLAALAELHQIDPARLSLPGYDMPAGRRDAARNELALWRRIYDRKRVRRWPLAEISFAILERHAPEASGPAVVCHGDVGPGNFMHEGGRVTAMLDWEFAHVGDPMDDLGWWLFRGHDMAGGLGPLEPQLRRWSELTGRPIDAGAIEYYRAVVMLRWLVSCIGVIDRGGSAIDRSTHHNLIPLLGALIPAALARVLHVELDVETAVLPEARLGAAAVIDTMTADVRDVILPALSDAETRRRGAGLLSYLAFLGALDRFGAPVRAADLDDYNELAGTKHDDIDEAMAAASDAAVRLAANAPGDTVHALARIAERNLGLWPLVAARARQPLTPVPAFVP
jgi:aminoglycoside phosphotransferase (APT) family kinase protein